MKPKIILAYSGGLDTSAIIPWLIKEYNADVIAYCCDLGNLPDEKWLRDRAIGLGASEFIFEDLKEKFSTEFVYPMVRAGATYQDDYMLGTAIARPLIAERVADQARILGAQAIAHGATGKGNDQLRFENAWAYLVPDLKIIAPWKIWQFKGRGDLQGFLNQQGHYLESGKNLAYSIDNNLFHTSTEGSELEDIEVEYNPEEIGSPTVLNKTLVSTIQIEFNCGTPIKLNSEDMASDKVLTLLNDLGRKHGIGLVDIVEERINGIKSRGIYVTPGGSILQLASKHQRQIRGDTALYRLAHNLGQEYGQLIYDGYWFSESRLALEDFFIRAGGTLTGSVELKLIGNQILVAKRQSRFSLYNKNHVSFEEDKIGFNKAASGYGVFATYPSLMAGLVRRIGQ
jgi:argininosuccinate synthase